MAKSLPGYSSIAEFAREVNLPYMTVKNHLRKGRCKWPRIIKNGNSKDIAYKCWENMVDRCTNPKSPAYSKYGARGIELSATWRFSFLAFIGHIGPRPSKEYSIDRIDNTKGYYPGNVRWATKYEQAQNTSRRKGYIEQRGSKYRAQLTRNGIRKSKTFTTQEEAEAWIAEGYW